MYWLSTYSAIAKKILLGIVVLCFFVSSSLKHNDVLQPVSIFLNTSSYRVGSTTYLLSEDNIAILHKEIQRNSRDRERSLYLNVLNKLLDKGTKRKKETLPYVSAQLSQADFDAMKLAIKEANKASKSRSRISARVGAVISYKGKIIGRGYNSPSNRLHAEQFAIMDALETIAREKHYETNSIVLRTIAIIRHQSELFVSQEEHRDFFRKITVEFKHIVEELEIEPEAISFYCTLGPCNKCADMISALGVKRLIVGTLPFNKKHKAHKKLKDAGITMISGVYQEECQRITRGYLYTVRHALWLQELIQRIVIATIRLKQFTLSYLLKDKYDIRIRNDIFEKTLAEKLVKTNLPISSKTFMALSRSDVQERLLKKYLLALNNGSQSFSHADLDWMFSYSDRVSNAFRSADIINHLALQRAVVIYLLLQKNNNSVVEEIVDELDLFDSAA